MEKMSVGGCKTLLNMMDFHWAPYLGQVLRGTFTQYYFLSHRLKPAVHCPDRWVYSIAFMECGSPVSGLPVEYECVLKACTRNCILMLSLWKISENRVSQIAAPRAKGPSKSWSSRSVHAVAPAGAGLHSEVPSTRWPGLIGIVRAGSAHIS